MAPLPTDMDFDVDVDGDVDLDAVLGLPTDPIVPVPERHREYFIEEFKSAVDSSERKSVVKNEIRYRKILFSDVKEYREWEKSRSKPINEGKGKSSRKEDEDLADNAQKKPKNAGITHSNGFKTMEYYMRCNRSYDACNITNRYKFVKGRKICISYNNRNPNAKFLCLEAGIRDRCFDTTWIAVHGTETICMVTRPDMDLTRFPPVYENGHIPKEKAMQDFARAVNSEVECLPYDDNDYNEDELRLTFSNLVLKPFCVVSEALHSGKDSSYYTDLAVEFLRSKVSSGLAFSDYETIQTAIGAYQRMQNQKFSAEDIWVTSFHFKSCYSEHLNMDQRREQLAIVNGLSSAEAPINWPLYWLRRYSSQKADFTPVRMPLFKNPMNLVVKEYPRHSIN